MTNVITLILIVIVSMLFGANIGFERGVKRGIDIAMETAIRETIKHLKVEFDKMGLGNIFKQVVEKTFDTKALKIFEETGNETSDDHTIKEHLKK